MTVNDFANTYIGLYYTVRASVTHCLVFSRDSRAIRACVYPSRHFINNQWCASIKLLADLQEKNAPILLPEKDDYSGVNREGRGRGRTVPGDTL